MKEVMKIEVNVGHIPHTAEHKTVPVVIKAGWPAKGARYVEYRTLRALINKEITIKIPADTEFDGWDWILPIDFLSEEISFFVSRFGVDIKDLERVNTRSYRATIVAPSWLKIPPEEEEGEEEEKDEESEPAE